VFEVRELGYQRIHLTSEQQTARPGERFGVR
jgi:hypothetical protein